MFKVKILTIGKNKKAWLEEAISLYEKRLKNVLKFEWEFVKDISALEGLADKTQFYVCLDERGDQLSSKSFAAFVFQQLEKNRLSMTFVIGGAEGLSTHLINGATKVISLSKCTFPHQLVRLILVEQIYRSVQIRKNTAYHK
jgi:23S rRNA (pseudouridine1915-N3)-methyltransferase